jgi:thiamine biosynthesis lipoprotein
MKRHDFPAMGTEITVVVDDDPHADDVRDLFDRIERVCSRFRPESELSRVNASREGHVTLSPTLAKILGVAAEARRRSEGLVDVGVGSAVVQWGYDRTFRDVADLPRPPAVEGSASWEIAGNVLTRQPGTSIDLGGIAKGWTCDRAIELGLARIVSAGGDVRSCSEDARVDVIDPWGETIATVPLGIGALATSSVTRRRWRVGDEDAHHLIDPRTRQPARTPVFSASVTATTATEAEVGAKSVLLQGADGLVWASQQDWILGALVVWHDSSVYATKDLEVAV